MSVHKITYELLTIEQCVLYTNAGKQQSEVKLQQMSNQH
jgi:hypothetical protein